MAAECSPSQAQANDDRKWCSSCCCWSEFVRDTCAMEDVLVCVGCGSVMEAGSLDDRREYTGSRQTAAGSSSFSKTAYNKQAHFGAESKESARKRRITHDVNRLCDQLRVKDHDKKVCVEKLSEIIGTKELAGFRPDIAIAAGLVFMICTDQSLLSLRKINGLVKLKEKRLRCLIKKLKEFPSFRNSVLPPRVATAQEVIADHMDKLGLVTDINERKECIAMSCSIFDLLLATDLKQKLQNCLMSRHSSLLSPILLLAIEYIHKTKTHSELYKAAEKKTNTGAFAKSSFDVRNTLFCLAGKIPALDVAITARRLTPQTVVKFLPTLIQNKSYLQAEKRVTDHERETTLSQTLTDKDPIDNTSVQQSSGPTPVLCVPVHFDWDDNDSGSLSDLDDSDIEQYLASNEEIKKKKSCLDNVQ